MNLFFICFKSYLNFSNYCNDIVYKDATLDGSDFEGADLSLANIEMAQLSRANLKVR